MPAFVTTGLKIAFAALSALANIAAPFFAPIGAVVASMLAGFAPAALVSNAFLGLAAVTGSVVASVGMAGSHFNEVVTNWYYHFTLDNIRRKEDAAEAAATARLYKINKDDKSSSHSDVQRKLAKHSQEEEYSQEEEHSQGEKHVQLDSSDEEDDKEDPASAWSKAPPADASLSKVSSTTFAREGAVGPDDNLPEPASTYRSQSPRNSSSSNDES